ncbi:Flp family type IVb pilin [Magnetovibrio blakemorei]|uniref:Pilus assembly protein n=1 Tax=Magnetovibrio blakemorei TaxID=28181 RepID=A0A1E5Q447_9PROT|nr:Flp family type IVb pilin [Magnetovibrio blakemorei]OEJ64070.1 hypothetical protein BEN30_01305 [Magnetovibrio blakemorei]
MKLNRMGTSLKVFLHSSSGATAIEYALIATLICVAIIGALTLFASSMGGMFNYISSAVSPGS